MAIGKILNPRLVRDIASSQLAKMFPHSTPVPHLPRRAFSDQLAHAKVQRLQILEHRLRRFGNPRMHLDHPVATNLVEVEATWMQFDHSEQSNEPRTSSPISPNLFIENIALMDIELDMLIDGNVLGDVSALREGSPHSPISKAFFFSDNNSKLVAHGSNDEAMEVVACPVEQGLSKHSPFTALI